MPEHAKTRFRQTALALVPFAACALAPLSARAQDSASANVRVGMIGPASVIKLQDMDFGRIAVYGTAGTVVLNPATSACTITGNLIQQGTCKRAEFTVQGRRNDRVRIREMNSGVVTLTGPAGATMTVTDFTINYSGMSPVSGGGNAQGFLGRYQMDANDGVGQFNVGGTLNVGAMQTPGVYNGTFVIQVVYN